jgi:hypothetical protein
MGGRAGGDTNGCHGDVSFIFRLRGEARFDEKIIVTNREQEKPFIPV